MTPDFANGSLTRKATRGQVGICDWILRCFWIRDSCKITSVFPSPVDLAQVWETTDNSGSLIMRRLLKNKWFKRVGASLLASLALCAGVAWYFGVWSWRDAEIYREMSKECHPIWNDLHSGRIRAGQDVEELITATRPSRVERYGEFVRLNYYKNFDPSERGVFGFTGVSITARSGKLVSGAAASCGWSRVFFDELKEEGWKEYHDAYEMLWKPIRKMRAAAAPEVKKPDREVN